LDGGERDKDPVIAPQMPAGGLIGQAILHNESHCHGDDTMSVEGFGQSVIGGVRVEEGVALRATVLRVNEFDVAGPTANQITQVMQHAGAGAISKARFATPRAR